MLHIQPSSSSPWHIKNFQFGLNAELHSALIELQRVVSTQGSTSLCSSSAEDFQNQKSLPGGNLRDVEMPPIALVLDILREIKGTYILPDTF